MSKFDRSRLLKFLSEPRFVHEVAEHYRISKKLAYCHLQEAIESGQVLISKKPVTKILQDSTGKFKRFRDFVYVFRESPILVPTWTKFMVKGPKDSISKSKSDTFYVRFRSDVPKTRRKGVIARELSGIIFKGEASSAKIESTSCKTLNHLLRRRPPSTQDEVKFISQAKKIQLFQALLKEPSTFLDLHSRFGVSKQTVRRLVKNDILAETWGSKGIGLRFKLTDKGKTYLKELEAAAKFEPRIREKAFIRLKHRVSF